MKCSTCGATRSHIGVLYPVRLLCKCEIRGCNECDAPAVVAEFQARLRGDEPALPAKSNGTAMFYCATHSPTPLAQLVPVANDTGLVEKPKRKEKNPHVDAAWPGKKAPPGSESKSRVQCSGCKDVHAMSKRKMFNGTFSNCPKCGDDMYTIDMEDAA